MLPGDDDRRGVPLKQTAYDYMKRKIVDGKWAGGRFLSERELQEELGMSKTPIRSALDKLEANGLITLHPKQGAVVAELPLRKIFEIYELRKALETYAARELTGRMDAKFFRDLDANLELQQLAAAREDITEYVRLDRSFHARIVAGLGNEAYDETMERIQDRFIMSLRTTFYRETSRLVSSLEEHRRIRDALAGADAAAAARLVEQHLDYVMQIMA